MSLEPIENENGSIRWDAEKQIIFGSYGQVITEQSTANGYHAWGKIIQAVGVENVRGAVLDFRPVERWEKGNVSVAQGQSYRINTKLDLSRMPMAMIVRTAFQEQMVRFSMKATPGEERKRIVHSMEEALAFIASFHVDKDVPTE